MAKSSKGAATFDANQQTTVSRIGSIMRKAAPIHTPPNPAPAGAPLTKLPMKHGTPTGHSEKKSEAG